ncbi:MAG TPA: poly(R)-hydroxyalkanoic acid synthase subunit PhaE [Candidatus Elarobacter sp.]
MADEPKDPMALWREMLGQWEKSVNALANQTMGSEEYSRRMNGAMGASLKLQESMRDAMTTYLATMNLPSRTDVARLDERVASVEAKLDRLIALVERGSAPKAPSAPRPPRTKRPPA